MITFRFEQQNGIEYKTKKMNYKMIPK